MIPAHKFSSKVPEGNTSYDPSKVKHLSYFSNSKSITTLRMKYRSFEDCAVDTIKGFEAKGWL